MADAPRRVDQPEPGFFEMRLVRGGPFVGARITLVDGLFQAWIDGEPMGEPHVDPVYARDVYRIWHSGRRIDEKVYKFRIATKLWARQHDKKHPAANPSQVINLRDRPSLF